MSVKQEKIDSDIIRKLTVARLSGYSMPKINKEFSEDDYPEIKVLINVLGSKILDTRFVGKNNEGDYKEAQEKFLVMTDNFLAESKNKFAIIVYSAQLLQYYTVICHDEFEAGLSYQEFVEFLENNSDIFGTTNKNPFIVEYKLIKIFNDLCMVSGSGIEFEKQLTCLINCLTSLQSNVDDFKETAPDYVFSQYLDFVINFIRAKLFECNYLALRNNLKEFSREEQEQHSDVQQIFIKQMHSALCLISDLFKSSSEHNLAHVKGLEYCFGQDLFVKFPRQNMETMERNINMLR